MSVFETEGGVQLLDGTSIIRVIPLYSIHDIHSVDHSTHKDHTRICLHVLVTVCYSVYMSSEVKNSKYDFPCQSCVALLYLLQCAHTHEYRKYLTRVRTCVGVHI